MKKAISILVLCFSSLVFAKSIEKCKNSSEIISVENQSEDLIFSTNSSNGMFVWKYLYQTTCGTYFYIILDKPFGTLTSYELENLNQQLIVRNQILCKDHKPKFDTTFI